MNAGNHGANGVRKSGLGWNQGQLLLFTLVLVGSTGSGLTTTVAADEAAAKAATAAEGLPAGKELYALHCAACHGETGDGKGQAAAYLFPKPRDFRTGRFRLVSTANNVPTRDDLHAVLLRGMPGSSMPPWGHLSLEDREALVDEILRLRTAGARDAYVEYLLDVEGLLEDELAEPDVQEEIEAYALDATTPGESRDVPPLGPPSDEAILHGRAIYVKQACASCHGATGKGDGVEKMVDAEKMPTSPRDFTLGIFKGGHDAASLFRRVAYGMPGTPMPSSSVLTPEEVVDLVHYIRSLSNESLRQGAILNRETIVAPRTTAVPSARDAAAWSTAPEVELRVMPLWWRNDPDPRLQVQAMHDGQTLAIRMRWTDPTLDRRATRSESFEDAAAMQLFRGDAEPFLGMGSRTHPVDAWFWDADRQTRSTLEEQYADVVVDIYPFSESSVETAEYARPGTRESEQPAVSLPAVASANQIVPPGRGSGASELAVGGPGSVTFRLPKSPFVTARGEYQDDHWTVIMQRQLLLAPNEGISLAPGDSASVAFALWDGSRGDRDGKKRITIWQELRLEP